MIPPGFFTFIRDVASRKPGGWQRTYQTFNTSPGKHYTAPKGGFQLMSMPTVISTATILFDNV